MTLTLLLLFCIFTVLILNLASADFAMFTAIAILTLCGVLSPQEALSGFANPGVITVALLFIVSESLKRSGNLDFIAARYLGTTRRGGLSWLMLKMMAPLTVLSAFINNTPIVVIFTPVIKRWAERIQLPASKFLIPLSYATIFGGICTLMGTSTNLLVHGLLIENHLPGYSLFELSKAGLPCAVAGMLYMAFIGKNFLPARLDMQSQVEKNPKEYVIEMKVAQKSSLAGKTIREAGLRNLPGLYLLDIERAGKSIGPVSARIELKEDDRLVFVGIPSAVLTLQQIPGLVPAAHEMFEQDFAQMQTHFVEAVVSTNSPAVGKTIKESDFRKHYGAGVVAVHRNGQRILDKVGSITLKAGDTLLLFTDENFIDQWKDSQDFYLVSYRGDKPSTSPQKAILTLSITFMMILAAALGEFTSQEFFLKINLLQCAMAAVILLILTGCINGRELKQSFRWDVLFTIAFSIGLSKALQTSGVAEAIAGYFHHTSAFLNPTAILILVYFSTVLVTEFLTNNAAVALLFPITLATASHLGVDARPFIVAMTIAASNGYASPLGYQTHLIVQGPGGYKFSDYVKVGLPLDLLMGIVAITSIHLAWPF
ncbi:MAG: SLC13 family permease [Candidatus Omnitrophica bacterium]|nr:SLC13 family permease [Candidatus Omnitrophota bacterium]